MSLEAWNILLSAVIVVLLAAYGFWLRSIFDQALKSKDASIESLKAAIASKDALLERMKSDIAPSIVKDYDNVRKYAEQKASEVAQLSSDLHQATEKLNHTEVTNPSVELLAEATGISFSSDLVMSALKKLKAQELENSTQASAALVQFVNDTMDAVSKMINAMNERTAKVKKLVPALAKGAAQDRST